VPQETDTNTLIIEQISNWSDTTDDTQDDPPPLVLSQQETEEFEATKHEQPTKQQFQNLSKPSSSTKYAEKLVLISWNSRGPKCREIAAYLEEKGADFGCFQEDKIPTNSKFKIGNYVFITSTDIKGGTKKKATPLPKPKPGAKGRPKPKAIPTPGAVSKGDSRGSMHGDSEIEHHGVMIVIHKKHLKALKWYKQISGSMMQICLKHTGPDLILNCVYAPNSRIELAKREAWFADFTQLLLENKNKMQITAGDMNARFHAKTADDSQIGKHVFGRGETFLNNIYLPELTNRHLFTQSLLDTDNFAMNTFFQKSPKQLITYREKLVGPDEWTPHNYAQIDFIIANRRSKNAVLNVHSDTDTELNSDHFRSLQNYVLNLKLTKQITTTKNPGKILKNWTASRKLMIFTKKLPIFTALK